MSESGMERSVISLGRFRCWGASHNGAVRDHNEDRFVNRPDLGMFAVADGAGGHDHGQVASSLVAEYLDDLPEGMPPGGMLKEIKERLRDAHVALREKAAALREGAVIATTVVVLIVTERHYAAAWVGDSRIYLLREGTLVRVTRDHSLVQELVDSGIITEEQAESHPRANIITRAIGADDDELNIDVVFDRLFPGDRFLLCSDGVTKSIDEKTIGEMLGADEDAPAERLLLAALARKATDNITAVTVEIIS